MLQTKGIEPRTLSLLRELMEVSQLSKFSLVGGTALALVHGHRLSVDLDLFGDVEFQKKEILGELRVLFANRFKYDEQQ